VKYTKGISCAVDGAAVCQPQNELRLLACTGTVLANATKLSSTQALSLATAKTEIKEKFPGMRGLRFVSWRHKV